jgi:hypothetical protein
MNDSRTPAIRIKPRLLLFSLAIVAGILGSKPFANAAGFPDIETARGDSESWAYVLRILSGLIIALATFALVPILVNMGLQVVTLLGRTTARPKPMVAVTLIICGTLCLLGTLLFEWYALRSGTQVMSSSFHMQNPGVDSGRIAFSVQLPLFGQVLALFTFLAGVALIALGIWSSIQGAGVGEQISEG